MGSTGIESMAAEKAQTPQNTVNMAVALGPVPSATPISSGSREAVLGGEAAGSGRVAPRWTFLTNHAHVLILLSQDDSMVLRDVASRIGITERAVQRIIADLEEGGVIEREKQGRQNRYRIISTQPLRHPIEAHRTTGDLLAMIKK